MKTSIRIRGLAVFSAVTCLASCGQFCAGPVDHRQYEKTPDPLSTRVWKTLAKSNPVTAERALYGRWGGPGNDGGRPIDAVDEACRKHDIAYHGARSGCSLRAADRALVEALEAIDEHQLDEAGQAYRRRAIGFFRSPWSRVIGKPLSSHFRLREPTWSLFHGPRDVTEFFDPSHAGFPEEPPEFGTLLYRVDRRLTRFRSRLEAAAK